MGLVLLCERGAPPPVHVQTGELQFLTSDPNISVVNLHPSKPCDKITTQAEQQWLEAPAVVFRFQSGRGISCYLSKELLSLSQLSRRHISLLVSTRL